MNFHFLIFLNPMIITRVIIIQTYDGTELH